MDVKNLKLKDILKTGSLVLLFCLNANAEGGGGSKFGLLAGYSVPDADNTNPHQLYGVKGSANITGALGLGGYYIVSGTEEGSGGIKYDYSLHGLELNYSMGAGSGETYLGFRVGLSKVRTTLSGTDVLFSPYHYGFVVGHDFPITSWFLVGFEGSYLRVEKSSTTQGVTAYQADKSNIINFLLSFSIKL